MASVLALRAIALALLSDLRVIALECLPDMCGMARKNIRDRYMKDIVIRVVGDVHTIPAVDATFS